MDYFDNLVNNDVFYAFANEFNDEVKIDQFRRINDTTISWTKRPSFSYVCTPNIYIELIFDKNNAPVFELTVKFFTQVVCFQKFVTASDAIDYVNNALNSARTRKQYRDEIWSRYGL